MRVFGYSIIALTIFIFLFTNVRENSLFPQVDEATEFVQQIEKYSPRPLHNTLYGIKPNSNSVTNQNYNFLLVKYKFKEVVFLNNELNNNVIRVFFSLYKTNVFLSFKDIKFNLFYPFHYFW